MEKRKTALVTGGTSGVGLSIVRRLVKEGYHVFFIGTSAEKGRKLTSELNAHGKGKAEYVCLDLSSLKDVKLFVNEFQKKQSELHLLANIAGVILPKRELTPEGFEKTFAIGYLSSFLLSTQLVGLLKKTPGSRIVNVSANPKVILKPNLDFENLYKGIDYNGFKTSLSTVHAKTILTQVLAEKLMPMGIGVYAFHPGMIKSELTRNMPLLIRIVSDVFSVFMRKDSETGIYVCTSEEITLNNTGSLIVKGSPLLLNFESDYKESLLRKTVKLLNQFQPEVL